MGRLCEQIKINYLVDQDYRDVFTDLLKRHRPDVVIIGGCSMATTKLSARIKSSVGSLQKGIHTLQNGVLPKLGINKSLTFL